MTIFPSEYEVMTLFQIKENAKVAQHPTVPFYYNRTTFYFTHAEYQFEITMAPSKNRMSIIVNEVQTSKIVTQMQLKNITRFEIIQNEHDQLMIRIQQNQETVYQLVEVTFKPTFQHNEKQYLIRL